MSELPPTTSVKRWFVTTNHKDIGILYTITALFFLLFGGVLALLIRMQLWDPTSQILSGLAYNEAVTAHGLIMVFWFLSPFGFGFANYFVPLQIGADDLAFPRLNALVLDVPVLRRAAGDQLLPGRYAERRVDDVRPAQHPDVHAEYRVDGGGARARDVHHRHHGVDGELPHVDPSLARCWGWGSWTCRCSRGPSSRRCG